MFTAYRNPRICAIFLLVAVASFLICSETEAVTPTFFLLKAAGFSVAYLTYRLASYWDKQGKLPELDKIIGEE